MHIYGLIPGQLNDALRDILAVSDNNQQIGLQIRQGPDSFRIADLARDTGTPLFTGAQRYDLDAGRALNAGYLIDEQGEIEGYVGHPININAPSWNSIMSKTNGMSVTVSRGN